MIRSQNRSSDPVGEALSGPIRSGPACSGPAHSESVRSGPGRGVSAWAGAARRGALGVVAVLAVAGSLMVAPGAAQAATEPVRLGGADRYAVSALVSAENFSPQTPVVFVASGAVYADALSASAAAGAVGGPVLLVTASGIPAEVAAELRRLEPEKIIVVGGEATVGAAAFDALREYADQVERIGGSDRYEVSINISAAAFPAPRAAVYVASGEVFPDALSGSAAAGRDKGPVILTPGASAPAEVLAEVARLRPASIVLLGGENTVSATVEEQLGGIAPVIRRAGDDRFEVSVAASAGFAPNIETVFVASGEVFPDALSGSAAAIRGKAPVLLVKSGEIPESIGIELLRLRPRNIVVLGGPASVSDTLVTALKPYIAQSS
jgi:putative cell wall-binding protein